MKILNDFVAEYKAILTMKNTYKDNTSKVQNVLKTLSLTLIMAIIAYVTAIIFRTTENLGYLFTMMNGIILGSFIIYKVLIELKIRESIKGTYKITKLVLFDSLVLVIILLLLTSFIMVTLLLNYLSYFVFITYIILLVITMTLYATVETLMRKTDILITSTLQVVQGTVYLYILFIALGYLFTFKLQTGIVIIYTVLTIFYTYKVLFNDMLGYIYKRTIYLIIGVVLIILLAYPLFFSNTEIVQVNPITIQKQELNSPDLNGYKSSIVTNEERVYLYENRIEFYDLEYNYLREMNNPGYTALHYFDEELVVRQDIATDKDYCMDSTFYTVTENGYEYRGASKTIIQSAIYEIDDMYVYLDDYTLQEVEDNCSRRDLLLHDEYKNKGIFVQTDDYLIFSRENKESILTNTGVSPYGKRIDSYQRYFYSNGYVLAMLDYDNDTEVVHEQQLSIMSADNFVYNSANDIELTLFGIEEFIDVTKFHYTEEYIMLELVFIEKDYNTITKTVVLDQSHNIVHIHEGDLSKHTRGLYTEEFVFGAPQDLVFNDSSLEFKMISIVTIIVLLFTIMPLPFLKGGVIND